MGRLLGSHDFEELDRSDLNKCPDCGCFFAQDNCPLCGKECPEEMRAGNRKPVKQKNKRRGGSGRVTFVDWYHSWWFIAIMMIISPIIGIILLATSPHKRSSKIIFIILAVIYGVVSTFGIGNLFGQIKDLFVDPVDRSLTETEYIEKCEAVTAEDFYRNVGIFDGKFVEIPLKIKAVFSGCEDYYRGDFYNYYLCYGENNGSEYTVLVRDCLLESVNFVVGDEITIYGEGQGNITVYDREFVPHTGPAVNAAYIKFVN